VELLHVKDIRSTERVPGRIVSDMQSTPVGAGSIRWAEVFRAADKAPIGGWFVEQEPPFARPPQEGLTQSLRYLKELKA
jgi:sugar phosphate isomerase/epimerase